MGVHPCGVSPSSPSLERRIQHADLLISESGAASLNMNPFLHRIIGSRLKPPSHPSPRGIPLPSFHIGPSAGESRKSKGGHGTQHTGPGRASALKEGAHRGGPSWDEVRRRVSKQAWRLALAGALRSSPPRNHGGQPYRQQGPVLDGNCSTAPSASAASRPAPCRRIYPPAGLSTPKPPPPPHSARVSNRPTPHTSVLIG